MLPYHERLRRVLNKTKAYVEGRIGVMVPQKYGIFYKTKAYMES